MLLSIFTPVGPASLRNHAYLMREFSPAFPRTGDDLLPRILNASPEGVELTGIGASEPEGAREQIVRLPRWSLPP
jgi:hypothetical protein